MPFLTPGSVVLITASSTGLGAATARAFAGKGVNVVVNYLNSRGKAEALVEEFSSLDPRPPQPPSEGSTGTSNPRFIAIQADISKKSEIIRLVEETVTQMGRLDAVISNQGWTRMRNFFDLDENVDEDDWDRCFNVNVKSHLFLFHAAREHLQKSRGAFVSIASLAGVKPSGSSVAYSVTKAAQIHLIKSLALTCGPIRVNSVSPGILLTDWGAQFPESKLKAATEKSPLGALATVEDVAQQIICLVDCASMTGMNAVIDAGWSL